MATQGLPLDGLRVLDMTVVYAGPYATTQLADWGAEVIRVESLQHFPSWTRGGMARPTRAAMAGLANTGMGGYPDDHPGERPWNRAGAFNHIARNKRSMTVNLTRAEGRAIFDRMIAISDGLLENNVPQTMDRLGITWDRLSAINPRLIMVRMPAFGLDGPYRDYKTFGNNMEALAGHPVIRAYPDLGLEYAAGGVTADATTGIGGAFAFLAGLRQRRKTGKGVLIELATAENFVPLLGDFIMDYTMNGRTWEAMGNDHRWLAPHNVYRCKGADSWVSIVARDNEEWARLCAVMLRPELAASEQFADGHSRYEHRRELDAIIGAWTAERDAYWVMERLQAEGVPAGVVMNDREILENRHLATRGFWQALTHPEAGTHRYAGPLWHASETPNRLQRPAPLLGEDNSYVYRELLQLSDDEYDRLVSEGHIGEEYDGAIP